MGFHTVGIAGGKDKEPLACQLGTSVYIDSQAQDPAAELVKLGGAKVILATATSGAAPCRAGLAVNGTLLVVGAATSMEVTPLLLLAGRRSIKGWYSGTSIDIRSPSVRAAASDRWMKPSRWSAPPKPTTA
jgi:D-arabinose 1-dehydrogenase-like Zn-dependent alcohol dehydrogenase